MSDEAQGERPTPTHEMIGSYCLQCGGSCLEDWMVSATPEEFWGVTVYEPPVELDRRFSGERVEEDPS